LNEFEKKKNSSYKIFLTSLNAPKGSVRSVLVLRHKIYYLFVLKSKIMEKTIIQLFTYDDFVAQYDPFWKATRRWLNFRYGGKDAPLTNMDLDDVTSDALNACLETLNKRREIPLTCRAESFLCSIAHNKAVDVIRKKTRASIVTDEIPDGAQASPLSMEDAKTTLRMAIDQLTDRQQQMLKLKYRTIGAQQFEDISVAELMQIYGRKRGISYGEIAHICNFTNANAARQAMYRLRIVLKELCD
jgi:RNA polymerase sigma factor (sigma-70 family)